MASFWYNTGLKECLDGTIALGTTTLKLMLVDTTYATGGSTVPAQSDTVVSAAIIAAEINVANYTRGWGGSGRKAATITLGVYNSAPTYRVDIALADLTWTALGSGTTIAAAILIKEGAASDATSRLIAYFDVDNTLTNGGDISLDFASLGSGGNMRITV